jgi:hypothetical protein
MQRYKSNVKKIWRILEDGQDVGFAIACGFDWFLDADYADYGDFLKKGGQTVFSRVYFRAQVSCSKRDGGWQ